MLEKLLALGMPVVVIAAASCDWSRYTPPDLPAGGAGGAGGTGGGPSTGGGGSGGAAPDTCGTFALVADPFEESEPSPLWCPFTDGSGSGISPMNGNLLITVTAGAGSDAFYETCRFYDLHGSSVSLRVEQAPAETGRFDFRVGPSDGERAHFRIAGGNLETGLVRGGALIVYATVAFDPTDHAFLRFREEAGTFYWETSSTGTGSFDEQHAMPTAEVFPLERVRARLHLEQASDMLPDSVRVDDFLGDGTATHHCPFRDFTDDFDDGSRSRHWLRTGGSGACTALENAGILAILFPPNADAQFDYYSSTAYDLTDDQVTIEIPQPPTVMAGARIRLENGEGWLGFRLDGIAIASSHSSGEPQVETQVVGEDFDVRAHRFLRIRHSSEADTIYWEVSADGSSWDSFGSVMPPPISIDALDVRLGGSTLMNMEPSAAFWDNFNVLP